MEFMSAYSANNFRNVMFVKEQEKLPKVQNSLKLLIN